MSDQTRPSNHGPSTRTGPTISVIIPVYNGGENFQKCLESLAHAAPPPDEIIVVSDGDTDGSWRRAESFGFRVLRLPSPGGPGRARNFGARAAKSDILLFIDSDVAIPPDAAGRIAAIFEADSALDALFGSYDDAPEATNFLSQVKNLMHHFVHQSAREEASTFWGACGAVRRELFLALGGFDESYRQPSIEDVELGYRLKQAGRKMLLCKSLQVKHLKRWRAGSLLKSDLLHRALPWTELMLRHGRLLNDLNFRPSSRASALLACGLAASLIAAWWTVWALGCAALLVLSLLALNAPLYGFFYRKRGFNFLLRAVLWHWSYYFYSALAFAAGSAVYLVRRNRTASSTPKALEKSAQ